MLSFQGRFYHWEAVSSAILAPDDVCSLICRGVAVSGAADDGGEDGGGGEAGDVVEFRRMGRDVADGTRCRPQSLDMCIRGKCRVSKFICIYITG